MIDVLMLYCFSVAALVSVAAYAGERVVAALGLPRRTVWLGALVISLCLPLFMIATSDPIATPTIATPVATIEVAAIEDSAPPAEMPLALPSVATMLKGLWILGSGGLLVFAFAGWIHLRVAARKWTSEQVEGVEVQVADNLGPAVFGFFNPKIVVPRWLLNAPAADRSAALAHERSHIAAGDTQLLLLGLLLIVMTPWNLPMWWQLRRLRFAIEVDCDQRVLRGGTSMATYGEMLLAVGQRSSRTPIGAIALTEPTSQLERRIRIMTNGTIRPIKLLILASLTMSVSLVAVAAQLDAPPLRSVAPSLFPSSVVTHEPVQSDLLEVAPTVKSDASSFQGSAPTQVASTTQEALVPAIDQPATSAIKPRVLPEKNSASTKRSKANPTRLAAANPTAAKTEIAKTSSPASASGDSKLKRILTVAPIFPDSALQAGIYDGFVEVAFTVAVTGDVQKEEVKKSEPVGVFDESALTAVRQWRFEPAVKDGVPQETRTLIRLKFSRPISGYSTTGAPFNNSTATALVPHAGERLNMKFTDVDIRSVLKTIADASGQNIVISDQISGKISWQLNDAPWEEALDLILRYKGLVKRTNGGVMFIEPGPPASTAL